MFTIKFYSADGCRQRIFTAESFTILRTPPGGDGTAEITLHQKDQSSDFRIDIADETKPADPAWPPRYGKAIIENIAGRTSEVISYCPKRNSGGTDC